MSKKIKQMEIDTLKHTFKDVRDLVVLSPSGVRCHADNQLRMTLRKKQISMQVVKNSLTKRVFDELGMKVTNYWVGSTLLAWGAGSLSELSREIDALLKKNDKIKVKGAICEGLEITFDQAKKMPTRQEAVGRVLALVTGPAQRLLSQVLAPASRIAAQIKTLEEKTAPTEELVAALAAAPAPA